MTDEPDPTFVSLENRKIVFADVKTIEALPEELDKFYKALDTLGLGRAWVSDESYLSDFKGAFELKALEGLLGVSLEWKNTPILDVLLRMRAVREAKD